MENMIKASDKEKKKLCAFSCELKNASLAE
jgi:hypothetical protein